MFPIPIEHGNGITGYALHHSPHYIDTANLIVGRVRHIELPSCSTECKAPGEFEALSERVRAGGGCASDIGAGHRLNDTGEPIRGKTHSAYDVVVCVGDVEVAHRLVERHALGLPEHGIAGDAAVASVAVGAWTLPCHCQGLPGDEVQELDLVVAHIQKVEQVSALIEHHGTRGVKGRTCGHPICLEDTEREVWACDTGVPHADRGVHEGINT
mmetsp:Transcript_12680/g.26695  ORF Transcript_12680/g.26695 Transcript_12680/m.26695 type:complete len:213 (+) Transcript_12680:1515-2153(+)